MIQARDRSTADALGTFVPVANKTNVIDCFGTETQVIIRNYPSLNKLCQNKMMNYLNSFPFWVLLIQLDL
jgi:hypothetical protein